MTINHSFAMKLTTDLHIYTVGFLSFWQLVFMKWLAFEVSFNLPYKPMFIISHKESLSSAKSRKPEYREYWCEDCSLVYMFIHIRNETRWKHGKPYCLVQFILCLADLIGSFEPWRPLFHSRQRDKGNWCFCITKHTGNCK